MVLKSKETPVKKEKKPSIFSLLIPYRKMVILLIVFALLGNGINLLIPKIISYAIDSYSLEKVNFNLVIIEFFLASLFIFIFSYFQSVVQTFTSERAAKDLRTRLTDKISRQSYAFIIHANPSKLLTNLTSDVDSIKLFVSQAVVSIFSSLFIIIGASIFTPLHKLAACPGCIDHYSDYRGYFLPGSSESQGSFQKKP
jgi:ATP-binding cassette subfamily B protein